jgi:chromosomal replication initiator protein
VLYLSTEQFIQQFIDATMNGNQNDFVHFYQMMDVLLLDDIQFLAGKEKTQDIFFHIFNFLHQKSKQIIITSDKLRLNLKGIEARLLSRFKWGLAADLQVPDYETRVAILQKRLYNDGITMPSDVIHYIANNISTNIRELEGALISLIAQSSLNKKRSPLSWPGKSLISLLKALPKKFPLIISKNLFAIFSISPPR